MKSAEGWRAFPAAFIAFGVVALALLVPAAMGERAPSISWSPTTSGGAFDYGAVTPGETASQAFTLRNSGGSASGALKIALSGSDAFSITSEACLGTSLGPRKSCAVTVEYAPAAAGQTDTATVTATGKKAGVTASITLIGAGTAPVRHIYWTNAGHTIGRANVDGTSVNQSFISVTQVASPPGVAVDGNHVYWTTSSQAQRAVSS